MANKETWPEFLQRLNELYRVRRLGQKTAAGYDLYLVDLSEWKLRFSNRTPLIWVKAEDAESLTASELAESLKDVAREHGWRHQDCIVLLDGDGVALKDQVASQYFPRFVTVDAADQQNILAARSFTGTLLNLICEQIPISNLAPYQTSAPVEGSGFFGREREIGRVLRHPEISFAIMGIRRIGKTSLLKEVKLRLLDQGEDPARVVWLDGSTLSNADQFMEEMVRELRFRELPRLKKREKYLFYFAGFLKRMSKMHGGRITIFLDEADPLLIWARNVPDLLPTLHASMNAGHCRYIVAGFQTLIGELYNQNSPFFMAFEPLRLGPFERKETEDVILRPMRSLRVRFENERELVKRIHNDTRGHPLLVQYYCRELIEQLERRGDRTLSPDGLADIYTSDGFKEQIVNAFRDNVDSPDKALVYALLLSFPESKEAFTQEEMYRTLRRQDCPYSPEQIDQTCDRLILAGILVRKGPKYQFANPIFPRVLRTNENLNYLLAVAKKEAGL